MASKMYNRARMTVTSTGTGSLSLGVAVAGYQTFSSSGAQNGDTVSYTIEDGVNWEIGTGTFTSTSGTLSRTVTQSYDGTTYGTTAISVTTNAQVFITALAADLTSTDTLTSGTLPVTRGGTGVTTSTGSGAVVLSTSPTLVTPALGTPASGTLTNCTFPTLNQNTTGTAAGLSSTLTVTSGGTGTATAFTSGSVVFAGASGVYSQSNSKLFWDNTNNRLGVGTATPSYSLDALQNVNSDGAIQITNSSSGTAAISEFRASNGTSTVWYGIGGTSYSAYAQIRANGAAIYSGTSAGIGLSADNASGYITFGTGSGASERMRIDSSGNVGIGTATPSTYGKLAVFGNTYISASSQYNGFSVHNGTNYIAQLIGLSASNDDGDLTILSGGAIKCRISASSAVASYINSGANFGIGTSSPSAKLDIYGVVNNISSSLSTLDASTARIRNDSTVNLGTKALLNFNIGSLGSSVIAGYYAGFNGSGDIGVGLIFGTQLNAAGGTVERARIDSSGNLLVGTTAQFNSCKVGIQASAASFNIFCIQNLNTGNAGNLVVFTNSAGTSCGAINQTGATTTNYGTSSDYRLKENVIRLENSLDRVLKLKPSKFRWKDDGLCGEGFIAHELQEFVAIAVTGEKDAVNTDGSIKPQNVDYSKLTPLLTAAIQELAAKVAALEGQINGK